MPATATTHKTYCKLCVAKCGVLLDVEVHGDGAPRVSNVRGDSDHPLSDGYLCPKGRAIGRLHHHADRLDAPSLGRAGVRTYPGWNVVLEDLSKRLSVIISGHGPNAVAAYGGNGGAQDNVAFALLNRFTRHIGSRSWYTALTIDSPAKGLVAEMMAGYSGLTYHNDDDCKMVLVVGANPAVSHGHTSARSNPIVWLRELAREGELWVADPRLTETARVATRHLVVRPGGDHAVLAYLVRELLDTGADMEFLDVHAAGMAELREAVDRFDAPTASAWSGVGEYELHDLLDSVRRHRRLSVFTGTGVTMAQTGNVSEWLAWALLVITGSMEQPGGVWFNPGIGDGYKARQFPARDGTSGPGPPSRPELPRRWGQYPCAGLVDEIESGQVRALLMIGGNPLASFPEPERVRRALESLEVFAVLEIMQSEVTDLATHLLACSGDLERAEIASGAFSVVPAIFAQRSPAIVPVGADRRHGWSILADLADRLGLEPLLPAEARGSEEGVLAAMTGLDMRRNDVPWGVVQDYRPTMGWVRERVLPEGRWRLAPAPLVAQLGALSLEAVGTGELLLVPRRQPRHMNSALIDSGGGTARIDRPLLQMHPTDAANSGVSDGELAEVRSRHGRVLAGVAIDRGIRQGVVSLPHGFVKVNVNALTSSHEDVDCLTGMVTLTGVRVTVSPAVT